MGKHVQGAPTRRRLSIIASTVTACTLVLAAVLVVVLGQRSDDSATMSARVGTPTPATPTVPAPMVPKRTSPAVKHATKAKKAKQVSLARIAQKKARVRAKATSTPTSSTLKIASLNILGSNHAGRGLARAAGEAAMLRDRGVDIVGLQEVQRDQRGVFLRQMAGYTMWPQDALGRQGYRKQILFRSDRYEMVEGHGVNAPFTGMSVPIPYVLLRDRSSGTEFWVVDSHNSPQGRQGERNIATRVQADLVNRLNDSHPVLMVGDMNEHTSWFCRIGSMAPVHSANGAYFSGGCHGPRGPVRIDWIVASTVGDDSVEFSGYAQDGATKARRLSDHYLVYADATVTD